MMQHDTRRTVLETIGNQRHSTVSSLAQEIGISPISVRHHLTSLQAEGLVHVELQRQPIGRPRHVYSLTEVGQRISPGFYHAMAERLLDEIKASLAPEQVAQILDRIAVGLAERYSADDQESTEARLVRFTEMLEDEGFRTTIRRIDASTIETQLSCPFMAVGQRHPELCRIDRTIMRSVLNTPVERTSCVLDGARSCTFTIRVDSTIAAR